MTSFPLSIQKWDFLVLDISFGHVWKRIKSQTISKEVKIAELVIHVIPVQQVIRKNITVTKK
jgi:hypothetical protein